MDIHIRKLPGSNIEQEFYLVTEVDAEIAKKDDEIAALNEVKMAMSRHTERLEARIKELEGKQGGGE